jgi:hypothetical protein
LSSKAHSLARDIPRESIFRTQTTGCLRAI